VTDDQLSNMLHVMIAEYIMPRQKPTTTIKRESMAESNPFAEKDQRGA